MLGNVYTCGSVAFALGRLAIVLGDFDNAEAHFESALAANRQIRATVWLGHTQCELASLLLTRDAEHDCARARELIASARQTAHALGLVRLQRKLELVDVRPQTPQEIVDPRATAFGLIEELAVTEARFPSAGGTQAEEAGSIEAMVVSAVSRARELGTLGTVTFLFSDIEDSSSLYEVLGDLRAHELIRAHNEIIRQQVAAHRGIEVKAFGDSFMIAFSSARRAALCAIATQQSFAAYCETHPDQPIRVRMGLHVGEAINEFRRLFRQGGDPCSAGRHARPGRSDFGVVDISRSDGECRRLALFVHRREAAQRPCRNRSSDIRDRLVIISALRWVLIVPMGILKETLRPRQSAVD